MQEKISDIGTISYKVLKTETQHQRELLQISSGARRYWDNWRRKDGVGRPESDTLGNLFQFHLSRMQRIQRRLASGRSLSERLDPTLRAIIMGADPVELTGISLLVPVTHCFSGSGGFERLASLASSCGAAVRRSLVIEEAVLHWKKIRDQVAYITDQWDYRKAWQFLKRMDLQPDRWPQSFQLRLGYWLLREMMVSNALYAATTKQQYRDILSLRRSRNHNGMRQAYNRYAEEIESRGLFTFRLFPHAGNTIAKLGFTDKTFDNLISGHASIEDLRPAYGPMVCPPVDWTTDHDGGFILLRNPLVKPVKYNVVPQGTNPEIREAVNILQRTPWFINRDIVAAVHYVYNTLGGDRAGLPPRDRPPMPTIAEGDDIKNIKLQRKIIWDEWYNEQSKRLSVLKTLNEASQLMAYEPVYFAWNMDFRGRMYPLADAISPQGADYQKAMITFANDEPVDSDEWLLINLANLYGEDKCSFEDRIKWAKDNMNMIRHTIKDWRDTMHWWTEADKPFCFLAAVLDYKYWQDTGRSRIPVCLDGSCNGIQHLSALGRDLVGAKATNLVDAPKPNDIYSDVAAELKTMIKASDSPLCQLFPESEITRKLVKRATMTTPYGVTRQGVRDQYLSDGHLSRLPRDLQSEASSWLTDLTTASIGNVVKAAQEVMAWLKTIASEANKKGVPLSWTTPDGKVVTQHYVKKTEHVARILGMGKVTLHLADQNLGINKHNQLNGTAPNYTHSLDATHARLTTRAMNCDLMMVHDAYGCHAARIPKLREVIPATFIDMHKEPLLEKLKEEVEQQLDITLGPPPCIGTLDLSVVSGARYFFA